MHSSRRLRCHVTRHSFFLRPTHRQESPKSSVSIRVAQEFFRPGIMKREPLPSNRCFPHVSSNSLRRSHVSNARRQEVAHFRSSRWCARQLRLPRFADTGFLFFVEWLRHLGIEQRRLPWQETSRLRIALSQLVDNLSAMSQIPRKDNSSLHHRSVRLRMRSSF